MNNKRYNKEGFLNHLNILKPNGSSLKNEGYYFKEENGRKIEIIFSYNENYPFDVTLYGISVGISYLQVEQIFHQIWQSFPNVSFGHSLDSDTFDEGFREDIIGQSGYHFLLDNPVSDDASFNKVYPYLNQLKDAAINFVNQYSTLQSLYNYAETLPINEQANFYNQPLTVRKMIIKKLLKISDFSTYATAVINNVNSSGNTERANFLQALKNHLDTF